MGSLDPDSAGAGTRRFLSPRGRDEWPGFATDPSVPQYVREYGRTWVEMPKVLVSRTRTDARYNTTVIGGDDAISQLADLRATTDGDIGVGGANLATQLLDAGLLDELLLFTHPVALGTGRPLFDQVDALLELELLEQQTHGLGVTMHRYSVKARR